mmetsp:Transcript_49982/g.108316  ORF Transcript_49982/g.108316 Transcript_49982/m.108316 type:complete len:255 (-) Transcript_49982:174-938(-)
MPSCCSSKSSVSTFASRRNLSISEPIIMMPSDAESLGRRGRRSCTASIESRTTRPRASGARACSAPRVSASVCVHCAFSPRGSAAARSSTKNRAAATKVACAMVSVVPCRLRLSVWCGSASVREKRSCSCGGEGRDDSRRSISAGTSSQRRLSKPTPPSTSRSLSSASCLQQTTTSISPRSNCVTSALKPPVLALSSGPRASTSRSTARDSVNTTLRSVWRERASSSELCRLSSRALPVATAFLPPVDACPSRS